MVMASVIRSVLEPMVTPDDLQQQPQSVTKLLQICQKKRKQVEIKQWRDVDISIANVFIVKSFLLISIFYIQLQASNIDLNKLGCSVPSINMMSTTNMEISIHTDKDGTQIVKEANHKFYELCRTKRCPKPEYIYVPFLNPFT